MVKRIFKKPTQHQYILAALIISIVNPKFLRILWTNPLGIKMVGAAMVMMLFGLLWMRKIIRIHV